MNIETLKCSNRIIFETIAGSRAYGIHIPNKSDFDIRGIYVNPPEEYNGLSEPAGQIGDEKHDTTYYSLKRFFELAQTANPNIIELLWMPDDCVKIKTPIMDELIENRDIFISKKCYHTHSGYAYAQIGKAKGANKMVHNPQLAIKPKKEDFCWIIPLTGQDDYDADPPFRPVPYTELIKNDPYKYWDLSRFHVSALEHVPNTYRMYAYDDKAKGIFRGDDMIVCESIPVEDEYFHFTGILIYNQHEFEKAMNEHRKYNDWMANRNESRWVDQEKGKLNYDQKNMAHCIRLLMSGESILRNGYPIVRFTGPQKDYLMKIRSGEMLYEDIMAEVDSRMKTLEELYKTSTIQHSVDVNKIGKLYNKLSKM